MTPLQLTLIIIVLFWVNHAYYKATDSKISRNIGIGLIISLVLSIIWCIIYYINV